MCASHKMLGIIINVSLVNYLSQVWQEPHVSSLWQSWMWILDLEAKWPCSKLWVVNPVETHLNSGLYRISSYCTILIPDVSTSLSLSLSWKSSTERGQSSTCWFILPMAAKPWAGIFLWSPTEVAEVLAVGHLPVPFSGQAGSWSRRGQLGLEPMSPWNAITDHNFICYDTMLASTYLCLKEW